MWLAVVGFCLAVLFTRGPSLVVKLGLCGLILFGLWALPALVFSVDY